MDFKKELKRNKIDSILITYPQNVFYLTGYKGFLSEEKDAKILITKKINYLFTDKRYLGEINNLKGFQTADISLFLETVNGNKIKSAGFEETSVTIPEYKSLKKIFKRLKPLSGVIEDYRSIKGTGEIAKIKKACGISDRAFKYILGKIKEGVTEEDIEMQLEIFIRGQKANISFRPIVAFGKNSAVPHHQTGKIKLKSGMIVLLDFGVNYKGYCSDMTRTFFFGPKNERFERIYKTVLEAQNSAVQFINHTLAMNQKISASGVDKKARQYITGKGLGLIPHSTGHGIGIQVHEKPSLSPKSKDILKSGMIFSIEPGIYLDNFGGVRIEDLFFLSGKDLKKLTHSPSGIFYL